jgi:hypothetical protein
MGRLEIGRLEECPAHERRERDPGATATQAPLGQGAQTVSRSRRRTLLSIGMSGFLVAANMAAATAPRKLSSLATNVSPKGAAKFFEEMARRYTVCALRLWNASI